MVHQRILTGVTCTVDVISGAGTADTSKAHVFNPDFFLGLLLLKTKFSASMQSDFLDLFFDFVSFPFLLSCCLPCPLNFV